ncbi:hypothetical protein NLJ89_g7071 [Agrocybe chaxingu]|uniref:F-box domain-containing protein n=1 Tax=Agrocybe chaxingu TaxID=84603 RepID=A0A9W8MU15_9AGAR|nr:hypothetical protein NLJ89_g7071 [Agrocybe chaxingu]
MMNAPRKSLLDLPVELLLRILSIDTVLSVRDFYILAIVCRQLHELALPLFLTAHDITDPIHEAAIFVSKWAPVHWLTREPDGLAGLSIATHVTSIKRLRLFFQDTNNTSERNYFQQASHLAHAVRRATNFVSGLTSIEEAGISLIWDPYHIVQSHSAPGAPHSELSEIQEWSSALEGLLNAILERGCQHLTVQYEAAIETGLQFREKGIIKKALMHLSRGLPRQKRNEANFTAFEWQLSKSYNESPNKVPSSEVDVEPAVLSFLPQQRPILDSLSIHTPVLLLPPFTNWTLTLLHTQTNLTSLSFAHIKFAPMTWHLLLPFVADALSSRLTELSILEQCPYLAALDLLRFVARLHRLEKLVVDRSFRLRFQEVHFPWVSGHLPSHTAIPSFVNLHSLQAPVEFVSLVLDARPASCKAVYDDVMVAFPKLRSLTVYPGNLLIHPPRYVESAIVINALHRRVLSLLSARHTDAQQRNEHVIEFSFNVEADYMDFESVCDYFDALSTQASFQQTLVDGLYLSEAEIGSLSSMHPLHGHPPSLNSNNPQMHAHGRSISCSRPSDSPTRKHGNLPKLFVEFSFVTHLVLHSFNLVSQDRRRQGLAKSSEQPARRPTCASLCRYLNLLFPALRRLEFTDGCHDFMDVSSARRDPDERERMVHELVHELQERCPVVKELVVGLSRYKM